MTEQNQLQPDDRFIRLPQVRALTGRSRTQIYGDTSFPRPVKLSRRESAWIEREVRSWMQARVAATRGGKAGATIGSLSTGATGARDHVGKP